MKPSRLCSFPDCKMPFRARDLCWGHYGQIRRGKPLTPLRPKFQPLSALIRDDLGRKHCQQCLQWLPEDRFGSCRSRQDGLVAACKDCTRAQRRAYGGRSFALALERNYSITIDQYEDLLASQGGACGSCHRPPPAGVRLHIDHDHSCCPAGARSCGKCIRGLLCRTCNTGLGMFYDDPDRLLSAAIYVLSHSRKAVSA